MDRGKAAAAALAALLLAGAAAWLLRGTDSGTPPPSAIAPTPDAAAGGSAPPPPEGDSSPGPAAAAATPTAEGTLVIPALPGEGRVDALLEVLRDGRAVASATAPPGVFGLPYPRDPGDAAPFALRAAAPGRAPVTVPLPGAVADVGEVRLLPAIHYSVRLVDARGAPLEGALVEIRIAGADAGRGGPTDRDGVARIPLEPGADLRALLGGRGEWGAVPVVEVLVRGRLFLPVDAVPEGILGRHDVVLEERPVGIRLRVVDGDGAPLAGAAVRLYPTGGSYAGEGGDHLFAGAAAFDSGSTDGEGVFAPLWPEAAETAALRIEPGPGRVLWTYLDRGMAEGPGPLEIGIPADPLVLEALCTEEVGGRPFPGARLLLHTNAYSLSGVADGKGRVRWALVPSESFDPEALAVTGWLVRWTDGGGWPRSQVRSIPFEPAGEEEEGRPPPLFRAPVPVVLGGTGSAGLWFRIREARGAEPFRPITVSAHRAGGDPAKEGWFLFAGEFTGPLGGPGEGSLWWCRSATEPYDPEMGLVPAEGRLRVELAAPRRAPLVLETDRAGILAARRAEGALVFAAAAPDRMERTVTVLDPEGRPARGAVVVLLAGAERARNHFEERVLANAVADAAGRATLHDLPPGGDARVAAWDPATNSGGVLVSPDSAAPDGLWIVRLEAPRPLRVHVAFAGSAAPPKRAGVGLAPLGNAFPLLRGGEAKDGAVEIPPFPHALYVAMVFGFSGREYRYRFATPGEIDGKEILLENR